MTESTRGLQTPLMDLVVAGRVQVVESGALPAQKIVDVSLDIIEKIRSGVERMELDFGHLSDQLDVAQSAPWPEWAVNVLKLTREYSGYDGFDDGDQGVDLLEEVTEAYSELSAYGERMKDRAERAESQTAELTKMVAGIRPIAEAPRDGTCIIAILQDDVFPGYADLEKYAAWNGLEVALFHAGTNSRGFNLNWAIVGPLGFGGIPDQWIRGWRPSLNPKKCR